MPAGSQVSKNKAPKGRAEESQVLVGIFTQSRGETPSVASLEAARASVTAENSPQTHEIHEPFSSFKAPSYKVPCPAGTKTLKPNDEAAKGDLAR